MKKLINYLLLLFIAIIWGSTFVILKDTVKDLSPFVLIAYRFTIASILLAIIIFIKRLNIFTNWKIGLISGVFQFLTYAPQTIGLQTTSASNSAFITGLFIIFVPIINFVIFRNKPKYIEILASFLSIIGLWVLTGGIDKLISGDFITLITAFSIAFVIILTNIALKKGTDPSVITFQQLFVTAVLAYILGILFRDSFKTLNLTSLISIAYLGVFASFIAFIIQNNIMKTVKPEIISIITGTEPFFALIIAWTVSYESYNGVKLIGGLIMFVAIILPELFNLIREKENYKNDFK